MGEIVWKRLPAAAVRSPMLDLTTGRGTLQMFHPAQGVLVTRACGHLEHAHAEAWVRVSAPLLSPAQKLAVFNDWELLSTYESSSRRLLTDWVLEHRAMLDVAWFTTGSRLVAMGVAAAAALTALVGISMCATHSRQQFEAELSKRL